MFGENLSEQGWRKLRSMPIGPPPLPLVLSVFSWENYRQEVWTGLNHHFDGVNSPNYQSMAPANNITNTWYEVRNKHDETRQICPLFKTTPSNAPFPFPFSFSPFPFSTDTIKYHGNLLNFGLFYNFDMRWTGKREMRRRREMQNKIREGICTLGRFKNHT